jgi:membrane protein DedA with SNARE-associated domain
MTPAEYIVLFVLVAIMGAGLPGLGDAALIAAGTLAGEGRLKVGVVLATAMAAWMLGSVAGYEIGARSSPSGWGSGPPTRSGVSLDSAVGW